MLLKHRRFVGTGSPIGSRNYSNGGLCEWGKEMCFSWGWNQFLELKIDDEGKEAKPACLREPKEEFEQ